MSTAERIPAGWPTVGDLGRRLAERAEREPPPPVELPPRTIHFGTVTTEVDQVREVLLGAEWLPVREGSMQVIGDGVSFVSSGQRVTTRLGRIVAVRARDW